MSRLVVDLGIVQQGMSALAGRGLYLTLKALVATTALMLLSPLLTSGGLDRLMEVLDEPLTIHESETATPLPRLQREIRRTCI
jgi:hypothetical protein